ncbi:MAG: hypothetical protein JXQ83_00450, partial [Candidatus Glassbacteria bacterium]|nr:hypothetical protein [Candidatus Glassbacteria bacterium]
MIYYKHLIILCIFSFVAPPATLRASELEERLAADAALAGEALIRCRRYLDAWSTRIDSRTGLLPQRITAPGESLWTPENSAADNFPFMVIAARFVGRPGEAEGLFRRAMIGEKLFALQGSALPTALELDTGAKEVRDLGRLIFGASEYAKDGLVPMLEILGPGPWSERMQELVEGIFALAPVETPYGSLPSDDAEVNGEMLQILCRLYWMTGRQKYLEWARRIGDAYCYEVIVRHYGLPAHHWDFTAHQGDRRFKARDHGCEIVSGLSLLYAVEREQSSLRACSYYNAVKLMLERIQYLAADKASGLLYNEVDAVSGEVTRPGFSDCWGYNYYAYYTFYLATGEEKYLDCVRRVLENIHRYRGYRWEPRSDGSQSQDGYADAVEGALGLLCHLPVQSAFDWVETETRRLFGFQQEDGTLEGWWGDGNFARTALMYAFYKTKGTYCIPWREDIRLAAEQTPEGLEVYLKADKAWSGRLCFDPDRHRRFL